MLNVLDKPLERVFGYIIEHYHAFAHSHTCRSLPVSWGASLGLHAFALSGSWTTTMSTSGLAQSQFSKGGALEMSGSCRETP
jgi:hypothetical protein